MIRKLVLACLLAIVFLLSIQGVFAFNYGDDDLPDLSDCGLGDSTIINELLTMDDIYCGPIELTFQLNSLNVAAIVCDSHIFTRSELSVLRNSISEDYYNLNTGFLGSSRIVGYESLEVSHFSPFIRFHFASYYDFSVNHPVIEEKAYYDMVVRIFISATTSLCDLAVRNPANWHASNPINFSTALNHVGVNTNHATG